MADEKEKDAITKQRDSIKVETVANDQSEVKEEIEQEEKEEPVVEEKEEIEEVKEVIEAKEEEIDDLKDDKAAAKTQAEKDRIQRRIDRLTKERSDLKAENENLKRQLAAKPDDEKVLTEDEVERRAELKSEQKRIIKEFEANCDKLHSDAQKVNKDFDKKVSLMAEEVGNIPANMIDVLADLPNGGQVLYWMTDNLDDAEEIYKMSPARMALKLSRISDELTTKTKKQISKAPAPKDKVSGSGNVEAKANPNDDMDTWIKKRNKEAEEHRRAKMGMH